MLSHSATHPFGLEDATKITFYVALCCFAKYFLVIHFRYHFSYFWSFVLAVYLGKYSSFKKFVTFDKDAEEEVKVNCTNAKNIAKGTTDPRVEFCLPK